LPTEVAAFGRSNASSTFCLELLGPWDISETALDGRKCFTIITLKGEVKKNIMRREEVTRTYKTVRAEYCPWLGLLSRLPLGLGFASSSGSGCTRRRRAGTASSRNRRITRAANEVWSCDCLSGDHF
jgi:hypothetical protein